MDTFIFLKKAYLVAMVKDGLEVFFLACKTTHLKCQVIPAVVNFVEAGSSMVVARAWERGEWGDSAVLAQGFSGRREGSLQIGDDHGCRSTVDELGVLQNCTLSDG